MANVGAFPETTPRTERADAHAAHPHRRSELLHSPVDRHGLVVLLIAFVVLTAAMIGIGYLIVDHLGALRELDDDVSRWLADRRTATWNDVTWVGSGIADTFVKVPAIIILSVVFLWRWRRWNEVALLAGATAFEAVVFVSASFVVDRARPPIPQLDSIPPTSSYPSGHTGAAVAFYGALAVIIFWHTRHAVARGLAVAAVLVLPLVVGASRVYRGMHHLSDVVVGLVVGAASLVVVWAVVQRPPSRDARNRVGDGSEPVTVE